MMIMEQRRFFAPDGTNMMLSWNQDKVPQSLRKSFSPTGGDYLPVDFVPGRFDVICARGKEALNHPGNLRYRHLIELYLGQYDSAPTKVQKSKIVSAIVEAVRRSSPTGGFVRFDGSRRRWYEVGDHVAREKTGQVFRDALHSKYSSSTKAKKQRSRLERKSSVDGASHSSTAP